MRITWRSDFEKAESPHRISVPASKRQIVELPNQALDKVEKEVALLASVAVAELSNCRLGQRVPEEASTFSHFLTDMEPFEGQLRSLLLDTSLSRYQATRLNRTFYSYQQLRPMGQLRRHIEFPLLAIAEHSEFIRLELTKALDTVTELGRSSARTVREPGWPVYLEANAAYEQAQATLQEVRQRLQVVLTPGGFRAARAALMALEVACESFLAVAYAHSEVLDPTTLNKMGPPLQRSLVNNGRSL